MKNLKFIKNKIDLDFIKNIILNILSAGILTGYTQLVLMPLLSKVLEPTSFGIVVTLTGFNHLISVFLGNTVNNIRLIYDTKINNKGNFTILVFISLIFSMISSLFLFYTYGEGLRHFEVFILVITTILSTLRAYLMVYFRLKFNYEKILITNVITVFGYILGIVVYTYISTWTIIFLIGEVITIIYLWNKTQFKDELILSQDNSFKQLFIETSNLTLSNGISQSLNYMDRFLITPLLGASYMSQYYAVSIFSKIINLFITPVNNVILSYLNKFETSYNKKGFIIYNLLSIVALIPLFFVMVILTPMLLKLLYPQYSQTNDVLILIINLANIFSLLTNIINPLLLKFYKMKYQAVIQTVFGITYIVTAIIGTLTGGLFGFGVATAFSYFVKWIIMVLIGTMTDVKYG